MKLSRVLFLSAALISLGAYFALGLGAALIVAGICVLLKGAMLWFLITYACHLKDEELKKS